MFAHFILTPIKKGANKKLEEYHAHLPKRLGIMKRVMKSTLDARRNGEKS